MAQLSIRQIREAIAAHEGYFERARMALRAARTAEENAEACQFIKNASDEIARWQAKLSEASQCT